MKKTEIKILIVEDDKIFAEALKQLLTRTGYTVVVAHNPTDALTAQKQKLFAITILDCLLPKMSGVDLALKMKSDGGLGGPLFLMSGIFKDKTFIKESVAKTGAAQFIPKPVTPEELLKIIEVEISPLLDETLPPMQSVMTRESLSPGEKVEAIKATSSLHGFELPRVLAYLMSSGSHSDGTLSLTDPEGRVAKMYFSNGKIVRIESQDRQSFFGFLLVERGLITHDKLDQAFRQPNPLNKRIGERLVDANLISPHWIPTVNTDQMGIRISLLCHETLYEMQFESSLVTESEGQFDRPNLALFLNDFVNSKLNVDWLKTHYSPHMEAPPRWTKTTDKNSPLFTFGPVARIPNLVAEMEQVTSLAELFQKHQAQEVELFSAVHLLVLNQMLYFPIKTKTLDVNIQLGRLRQMQVEIMSKDDFEILGVPRKSKGNDIKKAYYELSKTYHPDRLAKDIDKNLLELTKAVFSKITSAYNRLSDDEKRGTYLKELEVGQAEKLIQAESIIEEGKNLLKSGHGQKALDKFKYASTLRPPSSELNLYLVWAQLSIAGPNNPNASEITAQAEASLGKIPPEDRHNALYYFVRGLLHKNKGDVIMAMDSISHAVSLKSEFFEAKRELNLLQISQKKGPPTNILKADLKDVVGMLFKRR